MLDSLSVPRRAFDFEDYIDILRRNMRWLIAPTFAGLVVSTVVAYMMEDTYVSTALIRVDPQQISTDLVTSATSQDVADRISSMAQTILSRTTLTDLVTTYGLYKKDLKSEPMEDVIDKMHRSVSISPAGGSAMGNKILPAMQVGFAYSDKYTAQKVCADLVSRFMSLSSRRQRRKPAASKPVSERRTGASQERFGPDRAEVIRFPRSARWPPARRDAVEHAGDERA